MMADQLLGAAELYGQLTLSEGPGGCGAGRVSSEPVDDLELHRVRREGEGWIRKLLDWRVRRNRRCVVALEPPFSVPPEAPQPLQRLQMNRRLVVTESQRSHDGREMSPLVVLEKVDYPLTGGVTVSTWAGCHRTRSPRRPIQHSDSLRRT